MLCRGWKRDDTEKGGMSADGGARGGRRVRERHQQIIHQAARTIIAFGADEPIRARPMAAKRFGPVKHVAAVP